MRTGGGRAPPPFYSGMSSCSIKYACLAAVILAVLNGLDGFAGERAATQIDQTPALVVGSQHVSHYLFDKYYLRFSQAWASENRRSPAPEEIRTWLTQFVAQ